MSIRKKVHYGLYLLISMWILQTCKQHEIGKPEPEQKAAMIQKAKRWFDAQKQRARAKSSGDTLLASREPAWQHAVYYLMATEAATGAFIEMPLLYAGKYQINHRQDNDGKNERGYTKVILRQVSETEFQPIVMRFFADSTYLAQPHPALSQNLLGSFDVNFTGEAHFYDWEQENFISANEFVNGVPKRYIRNTTSNDAQKWTQECVTVTESISYVLEADNSGGAQSGDAPLDNSPTEITTVKTSQVCWKVFTGSGTTPGGGFISGGGNPYGGGGSGGSTPPNNPAADSTGFKISGTPLQIATFIRLLNKTTGNTYVHNATKGTIERTGTLNNTINDETQSYILSLLIEDVITGKRCCFTATLVDTDPDVFADDYSTGIIDLDDLQKMEVDVPLLAGQIGHFVYERVAIPNTYQDSTARTQKNFLISHQGNIYKDSIPAPTLTHAMALEALIVTFMRKQPNQVIDLTTLKDFFREVGENIKTNKDSNGNIISYTYIWKYGDFKYEITVGVRFEMVEGDLIPLPNAAIISIIRKS